MSGAGERLLSLDLVKVREPFLNLGHVRFPQQGRIIISIFNTLYEITKLPKPPKVLLLGILEMTLPDFLKKTQTIL